MHRFAPACLILMASALAFAQEKVYPKFDPKTLPPIQLPAASKTVSAPIQTRAADTFYTGGLWNCRGWNGLTEDQRGAYVLGLVEGIAMGTSDPSASAKSDWSEKVTGKVNVTNGERAEGIAAFCSAPENVIVPVVLAVQAVAAKVEGTPAARLEEIAAELRRFALKLISLPSPAQVK